MFYLVFFFSKLVYKWLPTIVLSIYLFFFSFLQWKNGLLVFVSYSSQFGRQEKYWSLAFCTCVNFGINHQLKTSNKLRNSFKSSALCLLIEIGRWDESTWILFFFKWKSHWNQIKHESLQDDWQISLRLFLCNA